MTMCKAVDWFLLGAMLSMYVLMTGIALWRTRDMLRESPKCKCSDKESSHGE